MRQFLSFLVLALLLSACAEPYIPPPKTAATYFQEGEDLFDRGLYEEAISSWEKVRDSFYSPELNRLAELKIAETHYLAQNYPEAATAYAEFLKNRPDDKQADLAMLQLGFSYYKQMLSADRDQTATRNALTTFEMYVKRFPDKDNLEEIGYYNQRCLNRLAEHELYVGQFYQKTGHFDAAIKRLEGVLDEYPNFFRRDKVYFYIGQAYLEKGNQKAAVEAFNTLFREFPKTEHILDAQKIMEERYR